MGGSRKTMIIKEDIRAFYESYRVLNWGNDFIYLLPHPALREWISNYTITFPSKSLISDCYTVIPHGSATLVLSCDAKGLHANLFGPATKSGLVGKQANLYKLLLIIEFQPAGLYAFTGIHQSELTDRIIPFYDVNGAMNRLIAETLEGSCNLHELAAGLDRLLLTNMSAVCPAQLKFTTQMIIKNAGNISARQLSGEAHYSERHLNRIFNQFVGMNVKSFSRLVRINKAIRLLHNPQSSITYVSDAAGFYDLPHFIHDFKSVCGITPQEYRNNMSDFYSEIAKF